MTIEATTNAAPAAPAAPAAAPAKGTPEYAHEMAWRADNPGKFLAGEKAPAYQPPVKEEPKAEAPAPKPAGGFDKFYDPKTGAYNWQAHAAEAEWKLAQKTASPKPAEKKTDAKSAAAGDEKPAEGDAKSPDADTAEKTADDDKSEEQKIAEDAGLDFQDLERKVLSNWALEDGDYAALEKAGIPKNIVDAHIQGLKAAQELNAMKAAERAGGKAELDAALKWAEALPQAEKDALNAKLGSREWELGVDALMQRYNSGRKTAGEPGMTLDGSGGGAGEMAFASQAEYLAAMAKTDDRGQKLYNVDPAYRERVRRALIKMK